MTCDYNIIMVAVEYLCIFFTITELDPRRQRTVGEQTDLEAQPSEGGSNEHHRYMKLKKTEQITSDGYVKSLRAHVTMEGEI